LTLVFTTRLLPAQEGPEVASLAEQAVTLRSIDPQDRDFSDLEPLVSKIGSARIVVLGEATHGEGSTSGAKARLAIFLHQNMGFDVLAWEAGVLDCAAMDRALRDPSVPLESAAGQMMLGGWDASAQVLPLFEHARVSWQTERPLRMAGFDGERPPHGSRHFQAVVGDLGARGVVELDAFQRDLLAAFADRAFGYIRSDDQPIESDERAAQLEVVGTLSAALDSAAARERVSPVDLGRLRSSIRQGLAFEEVKQRVLEQQHPRDPLMARTFHWLATEEFAGRKIIIWAATAHLTRNTKTLKPVDRDWNYAEAEHMGDGVYRDFGDQVYTIAVTSHHGSIGVTFPSGRRADQVRPIDLPIENSFEDRAHQLGQPHVFIDLRNTPPTGWMRGEFVARPLGFIPTRAVWRDVIDAFLFIDEVQPECMP
jgi:erythromycin esterase